MSAECNDKDPTCHHCHITCPIPLNELIKTHPLRLKDPPEDLSKPSSRQSISSSSVEKVKADVHRNDSTVSDISSKSGDISFNSNELKNPPRTVKLSSISGNSTFTKKFKLLRPTNSFLHRFTKTAFYRKTFLSPTSSTSSRTNLNEDFASDLSASSSNNLSDDSSLPNFLPQKRDVIISNQTPSSICQTLSRCPAESKQFHIISNFKESGTQTSIPRSFLKRHQPNVFSNSEPNFAHKKTNTKRTTRTKNKCCSLPTSLLIAGYLLLIVIATVLAVALGQRERRIRVNQSPSRHPQVFPGAQPAPVNQNRVRGSSQDRSIRRPVQRTRISTQVPRRRFRPGPQEHVAVPVTTLPPPRVFSVESAPKPSAHVPMFRDEDFDYFSNLEFDDAAFHLPTEISQNQIVTPRPSPPRPSPPRQVATQSSSSAQEVRTVARAPAQPAIRKAFPRRGLENNFKQEFNIDPQQSQKHQNQENLPRGQKQPEVQIVKSWSNRNPDGTFSWGYINTDGTFKNETKGIDCVVRGVYGYIDKDTGETLTFPYATGNPCDPNAPDYFYDYESGVLNLGAHVDKRPKTATTTNNRRPVQ